MNGCEYILNIVLEVGKRWDTPKIKSERGRECESERESGREKN